jgi:hypothetical protein
MDCHRYPLVMIMYTADKLRQVSFTSPSGSVVMVKNMTKNSAESNPTGCQGARERF